MRTYPVSPKQQSGIALVVVLMFLILIMIAGAIAVRQSSMDLKLATADQVGTLLLNSSDSVIASVEQAVNNATPGTPDYKKVYGDQGIMGYFTGTAISRVDEQIKRCYTLDIGELFNINESTRMRAGSTGQIGGDKGICNPDNAKHYTSNRQPVMTQIVMQGLKSPDALTDNTAGLTDGQDSGMGDALVVHPKIAIHSVSVLPTLSKASDRQIRECLKKPVGQDVQNIYKADQNMTSCLKDNGIPATALVEEVMLLQEIESKPL